MSFLSVSGFEGFVGFWIALFGNYARPEHAVIILPDVVPISHPEPNKNLKREFIDYETSMIINEELLRGLVFY